MFDCNSFLRRKNLTQKELAKLLGIGTSTVGMWCTNKSTPSYAVVVELIKLGMTIEEIFGKEVSEIIFKNSNSNLPGDGFDSPEFRKGVARAIEDMKARGLI